MCARRLDDWRIEASAEITTGVPPTFPGGPSFKPGDTVQLVTVSKNADGKLIGFIAPSATALALSIATRAAKCAMNIRNRLEYRASISPMGTVQMVDSKESSGLFDFFEHCMISVTFSFQAIEVFCNHTISRNLKEPLKIKRRKTTEEMSPKVIERKISTEDKLGYVLP